MPASPRRRRPAAALLAVVVACRGGTEPAATDLLPPQLAVRSDTPYIIGAIVGREPGAGTVRLHVRAPTDDPAWGGLRREAHVTVHPDSLLLRPDGRAAPLASFAVGRTVLVWVRGPELESLPPQVTGSAILVRD